MLSQYSTKVKVRVGLGILMLVLARAAISFSAHVFMSLAWTCVEVGLALCIWGAISHARDKGYPPPNAPTRSLLVFPVAVGVYAAIFTFLKSATWLVCDLTAICFAPRLDSLAAYYPFIVVRLVITSILGSYYFVLAGARTAPHNHFATAKVLAICYLCGSAPLLFGQWFWYNFGMWGGLWTSVVLWACIPWTCGCGAVIVACAHVRRHESRIRTIQQEMPNNSLERR